jgi:hypothetical protein
VTRAEQISRVYDQLKQLQLSKNADYGDSAFEDVEVFGQVIPAKNGILARIADKLKRLESEKLEVSESKSDTIRDLIGYLVVLLILDDETR